MMFAGSIILAASSLAAHELDDPLTRYRPVSMSYRLDTEGELTPTLEAVLGGRWSAFVSPIYGHCHIAWSAGEGRLRVDVASDQALETNARSLIARMPAVFGVAADDLSVVRTVRLRDKVSIIFQQKHDGIPILTAYVRLLFDRDGTILAISSDAHPQVASVQPASVTAADAVRSLAEHTDHDGFANPIVTGSLLLPDIDPHGRVRFVPIWTIESAQAVGNVVLTADIDGMTGAIIRSSLSSAAGPLLNPPEKQAMISGQVTAKVYPELGPYWADPEERPLPLVKVRVGANSTFTDADGYYTVAHDGTATELVVDFNGQLGRVYTSGGTTPVVTRHILAESPPPSLDVYIETVDNPEVPLSEVNIFYHMAVMRLRLVDLVPQLQGWNDNRLVNGVVSPTLCESYGGLSTITLAQCNGSYQCPYVASIVYHELTHSLDAHQFYAPTWVKEPRADTIAILQVGDRKMGRGYPVNYPNGGVRLYYFGLDPNASRFPDCDQDYCSEDSGGAQPHSYGRPLCGFYLDVYEYLLNPANPDNDDFVNGELDPTASAHVMTLLLEANLLGLPQSMQSQVVYTFLVDDDDSDPSTPSPTQAALCWAATARNFLHLPALNYCIPPAISVAPDSLATSLATGGEDELEFTIANEGGNELTYDIAVTTGDGWLSVSPASGTVLPGGSVHIAVHVNASGLCGAANGELQITSNDEAAPLITMPISLTVTPAPEIIATPAELDFEQVPVYAVKSLNVQVRNIGCTNLQITSISTDNPVFFVNSNPTILAPGGRTRLTVSYFPPTDGTHAGNLIIASNDPYEGNYLVPLTGEGVLQKDFGESIATGPRAVPNPFNPTTEFQFNLERAGRVELEIYDVSGRRVQRINAGTLPAGQQRIAWDGYSASAERVASGMYFTKIYLDGEPYGKIGRSLLVK
jgi:hypothetical protein